MNIDLHGDVGEDDAGGGQVEDDNSQGDEEPRAGPPGTSDIMTTTIIVGITHTKCLVKPIDKLYIKKRGEGNFDKLRGLNRLGKCNNF